MSLTDFQRAVCRLVAAARVTQGECYVAGGSALNELLGARRVSRDVDLFNDTRDALLWAWRTDRATLESAGYVVSVLREYTSFVEAEVRKDGQGLVFQWAQDSAYRFFPLVAHPDFGVTLHPFDLATNKVLALVGRLEVRDWIDVMTCHERLQPLGYLAWAASGKDPGLNPAFILDQARRSARYTREEVATLDFEGSVPDAAALSGTWRRMLSEATHLVELLPEEHVGSCVTDVTGDLFKGDGPALEKALKSGGVLFHNGSLHGAWPALLGGSAGRA